MNNRLLNSRENELLDTLLQYDRASVQIKALANGSNLAQEIQEAADLIKSVSKNGKIPPQYIELCHQVSTYYLYYLRNESLAVDYLSLIKNSLDTKDDFYGEICNELGHAKTIDGNYAEDNYFKEALTCPLSNVNKAFSLRYLALIAHRQNRPEEAIELLNDAIALLKPLSHYKTPLIDLAECKHLLGVVYDRQNALDLAEINLLIAKDLEEDFVKNINGMHLMQMITMQSLGALWIKQGKAQDAVILLQECLEMQEFYYKTGSNADIAKTHHFLGDAFASLSMYEEAKIAYQNALAIKLKLYNEDHSLVKVTRDALSATQKALDLIPQITRLNQEFDFDWNNYKTYESNAKRIEAVETLLADVTSIKVLSPEIKQQLGELNYKLGTYYNHIARDPDKALTYYDAAKPLVENDDLAKVWNHIAYSYQQKMAGAEDKKTRQKFFIQARDNYNYILDNYVYATVNDPEQMKVFAFAMCIKALTEYEASDLKSAQLSYRHAIECYETIKTFDDQYARTMRRYGIILDQLGLDLAAKDIFEGLVKYWQQQKDVNNPYARQFYETYADFLVEHSPQQSATALQFYRLSALGDPERKEAIDAKVEALRKSMATESTKQLPKLGFHQPAKSQLTFDEPVLHKVHKM